MELSRQLRRNLERNKNKNVSTATETPKMENKPISRHTKRFSNKINKKFNELVNAWFRERAKLADPDSQEAVDALDKYNKLWMHYCHKNLAKPKEFLDKFIDVCDKEDKRMREIILQRAETEKLAKFNASWKEKADLMEKEGMNAEQISLEFNKFAEESNILIKPEEIPQNK